MDKFEDLNRRLKQDPFSPWKRMKELLDEDLYTTLVDKFTSVLRYNEMYPELGPANRYANKYLQPFFERYNSQTVAPREEQEKLVNACDLELLLLETGWR